MTATVLILVAVYVASVVYRAYLMTRIPKFCQDVKHCTLGPKHHRVVIVAPPRKLPRIVLKHV